MKAGLAHEISGRFIPAHLQGVNLNADGPASLTAVGKDGLDWPKILAAGKKGGLKNYFVEQNWDPTVQGVSYLLNEWAESLTGRGRAVRDPRFEANCTAGTPNGPSPSPASQSAIRIR